MDNTTPSRWYHVTYYTTATLHPTNPQQVRSKVAWYQPTW